VLFLCPAEPVLVGRKWEEITSHLHLWSSRLIAGLAGLIKVFNYVPTLLRHPSEDYHLLYVIVMHP
jgi:hypothetical protein